MQDKIKSLMQNFMQNNDLTSMLGNNADAKKYLSFIMNLLQGKFTLQDYESALEGFFNNQDEVAAAMPTEANGMNITEIKENLERHKEVLSLLTAQEKSMDPTQISDQDMESWAKRTKQDIGTIKQIVLFSCKARQNGPALMEIIMNEEKRKKLLSGDMSIITELFVNRK